MQTMVAYAFAEPVAPERLQAARASVEQWYRPRWVPHPQLDVAGGRRTGMALWTDPDISCRWPAWAQSSGRTSACLHVPLGYQRLIGSVPPEEALLPLTDHLQRHPEDLHRLTPPFVLASVDADEDRLSLQTDALGLGRLFELRTSEVTVWSNRPVAALRFAGVRAQPDRLAWRRMAACDWPMGSASPYRGVRVVEAATRIETGPGGARRRTCDALRELVAQRREPLTTSSLDRTAVALAETARSIAEIWPEPPTLSLSGGRDSRLVVAAFVAAGLPVRLRTYGAACGEADTARRLVGLLPEPVEHEVSPAVAARPGPNRKGALARARGWHDATEGLRPASYLRSLPPRTLLQHDPPLVCGVGGEFGHAPGYPDDVEQLERRPARRRLDAFARSLEAKVVLPTGLSRAAREAAGAQVREVLAHAASRGVSDAKALDWFYADERLRRWGMTGESAGRLMPLLVPEFVTAAFGLTTEQSRASALHTALIDRLVPQWTGVPFYTATLRARQQVRQRRLWEGPDGDDVAAVLADPSGWADGFDVRQVQAVWDRARAGRAAGRDELLLQRVVWRAAFADHLAAVNGEATRHRRPAPHRRRIWRARPVDLLRALAVRVNDVPRARRLARTAVGRRLRRVLGV